MGVRVNKEYLEELSSDRLQEAQTLVTQTFKRMSDRQFLDWVKDRYPEAGSGQVNVGVVTEGNTIHRFNYGDIRNVVEAEFDARMNTPRIQPNMVVVEMPTIIQLGIDPVEAMKAFIKAFQEYTKNGPTEPTMYAHREDGYYIDGGWILWHSEKFSVDQIASWKAAATKIAEKEKIDLKEYIAIPDRFNQFKVIFTKTIEQRGLSR